MKEIPLTRGLVALVDDEDYEALASFKWRANADGYAIRDIPHPLKPGKRTVEFMHRRILGLSFGQRIEVDHWNGCTNDNRRENIRKATRSENARNISVSGYKKSGAPKGTYWHARDKKWIAQITIDNKLNILGYFDSADDAHHAYRQAAATFHGEFARFD